MAELRFSPRQPRSRALILEVSPPPSLKLDNGQSSVVLTLGVLLPPHGWKGCTKPRHSWKTEAQNKPSISLLQWRRVSGYLSVTGPSAFEGFSEVPIVSLPLPYNWRREPLPPSCLSTKYLALTPCWPWVKEQGKATSNRQSQCNLTRNLKEESPRRLWEPQEGCLAQGRGPREGDVWAKIMKKEWESARQRSH